MIRLASVVVVAVAAATLFLANSSQGQGKVTPIKIGDAVNFTDLPGVDGKKHSLSDYKKDVVVVVITCNHCPVAVRYEDRIIKFAKDNPKVDLVAINVNNTESDKMPKMIDRAKQKGFNFPYLYDETQTIARTLGATVTPHFFVLNKERKLVYRGAMEDNEGAPKVFYLNDAVKGALSNETLTTSETRARGCGVAYDK